MNLQEAKKLAEKMKLDLFKYDSEALYIVPLRLRESKRKNCGLHLIFVPVRRSTQSAHMSNGSRVELGWPSFYAVPTAQDANCVELPAGVLESTRQITYSDRVELKIP